MVTLDQGGSGSSRIVLMTAGVTTVLLVVTLGLLEFYWRVTGRQALEPEREHLVTLQFPETVTIAGQGEGGLKYLLGSGQTVVGHDALTAALAKEVGQPGAARPPVSVTIRISEGVGVSDRQMADTIAACRAAGARVEDGR